METVTVMYRPLGGGLRVVLINAYKVPRNIKRICSQVRLKAKNLSESEKSEIKEK